MDKQITIIGAGMAGLLAANILRRHTPKVVELQPELPKNHSALLRFRTSAISNATGIPFSKVKVRKAIWDGRRLHSQCTMAMANQYSTKVTGQVGDRSIWNLEAEERRIAPPDFIQQIAQNVPIAFGVPFSATDHGSGESNVAISTLPMCHLMKMLDYPNIPSFHARAIFTINATITRPSSMVHQTVYSSYPSDQWYRATIHGSHIIVECTQDYDSSDVDDFLNSILVRVFGFPRHGTEIESSVLTTQKFGKIYPIDDHLRKSFIVWASDNYNIYSLGRFATWRPLLLDDLVADIQRIESMIESPSTYNRRLAYSHT